MKDVVFSGIQPTGLIHVGNYLGAIRKWVALQDRHPCYYCVVDYHAITAPYDPADLPRRTLEAVAANVAAGLDPDRSVIFVQSQIPEHTELCWIFNAVTPVGELQRMTQYKDKARQRRESVNAGLLNYPILQAADILLYRGTLVPVGEDQAQHLEFAREVARRFNALYGETFPEPQVMLGDFPRVLALNDPAVKMSKSVPGSYIALTDEPETIREAVAKAVTDTGPRTGNEMSPGVKNLFDLLGAFSSPDTVRRFQQAYQDGSLRYVELKRVLADDLVSALEPVRRRYRELLARPDDIRDIVRNGADRARPVARATLAEVREKVGILRV
ncbi:MAG: tryptophan--tRNA ligase [bacterium]|nr:tryptophan--tRNA ligase [bacterium]